MNGNNSVKCCKADYLVCTCMGVMRSEIIESISSGCDTYDKLQEALGVGTGCNSCVNEVHDILESELKDIKK